MSASLFIWLFHSHCDLQVISKEANFVTVRLNRSDDSLTATPVRTDLVCSVRALLKKIKQTVLVGDNVQVDSIDWAEKRGTTAVPLTCMSLQFEEICLR